MALALSKTEDLIEYMKGQGIKFKIWGEDSTIEFLNECTYYKKVSCYKKNFITYKVDGKALYADLDFAYLKEMSSIDADLRSIILTISLNIEHAVKVRIINKCLEFEFNGFDITEKFFEKYPVVKNNILKYMHNSYCEELINAHKNRMPIWVVVETMHMISKYVSEVAGISQSQRKKALKTKFYYDFTCLLYSIDYFMKSNKMKTKAKKNLDEFARVTAIRHKEYFKNCNTIKNAYSFFTKILDNYG